MNAVRTFALNPTWDRSLLSLIVMVQNNTTRTVLQAARATPAYEATVTLDCEPDGVMGTWHLTGPYDAKTGSGDAVLSLFDAGQYTVTWDASPYWTGPSGPQMQTIAVGGAATFHGLYSDGPFTAVTSGALGTPGQNRAGTLVDVDGDGDLDIHVVRYGEADQLLRNDGALGFTDIAAGAMADPGQGIGAAWGDVTGDGRLDVYVARADQANLLFRGDGAGGFLPTTIINAANAGPATGANAIDFNLDGKLDIFLYQNNTMSTTNLLLSNFGDIGGGTLLFITQSGNLTVGGNTAACAWTDGDLDGRLDPYVVKRYGTNQLFQNLTIGFSDLSPGSGLYDTGNDAAAAWGDFDNDGDFDLYLANDGSTDRLYRATTPFHFEIVEGPGLGDAGHARGVAWADLDNDGHLDLYVPRFGEPDLILMGDGAGGFTRVMAGAAEANGRQRRRRRRRSGRRRPPGDLRAAHRSGQRGDEERAGRGQPLVRAEADRRRRQYGGHRRPRRPDGRRHRAVEAGDQRQRLPRHAGTALRAGRRGHGRPDRHLLAGRPAPGRRGPAGRPAAERDRRPGSRRQRRR